MGIARAAAVCAAVWGAAAAPGARAAEAPDGPSPAPDELTGRLRRIIIDGVARGERPLVFLDLAGGGARARLLGAGPQGVRVSATGTELDISWDRIQAGRAGGMALRLASGPEELLVVARYFAAHGMRAETEDACAAACRADPGVADRARAVVDSLPAPKLPEKTPPKVKAPPARRNHEGRVLPPAPPPATPLMFDTPEADLVLASMQVFPRDNPWNQDVSKLPVHPRSEAMIARMGRDTAVGVNLDMCFVLVPPLQPPVDVSFASAGESDKGPYPIPDNAPVEGWPLSFRDQDLRNVQRRGEGDRHVIVVDPVRMMLYELYAAYRTDAGWRAGSGAVFDLRSNDLRPERWTSADAAGLPIFPAVVRFDECERGMVEHALRVTARRTRRAYLSPARHQAGSTDDPDAVAMGQRLRLKADVDISGLPAHAQAVARGMKTHGLFVADNGGDWRISAAPDRRLKGMRELQRLTGADFEVVGTGPEAGAATGR